MSQIEIFQFPVTSQQIRTVMRADEPWFSAADVCSVLAISNARDAVRALDDDEVADHAVGNADTMIIKVVSEAGLYSLILRSRKPEAKAFKRWVTHDVLPQIRMTGRYEPQHSLPQTYAQALRELATSVERAEEAERALAIAGPKAEAWEVLASAEGDYSVREAAYILNRDPAIETGQNRLFQLLRDWRLIDRTNRPYADHARHVQLRATHYTDKWTGEEVATTQVRITIAGLRYLHQRLGGVKQLSLIVSSSAA